MPEERKSMRITLTTSSLVRILVVLLLIYFAWLIQDVLAILFVTLVLSSTIDPWVDAMQKRGIPRALGISILYIIGLGVFGTAIYLIIPPIVEQLGQLAEDLPAYADRLNGFFAGLREYSLANGWIDNIKASLNETASSLPTAASSIFAGIYGFFDGILSLVLILVITFYMTVEQNAIKRLIWSLTPHQHQTYVMDVFNRMQKKLGLWLRGQLILCLAIFALTYIGLLILGVEYALILAIIAGLTEFIPYLGPILGAVPAVFLAFTQSPTLALFVIILYVVIQQIENNFLVPKIMQKAVGLNPIVSIAVLMVGFSVGGVMGALLSIPVATAATVIIEDLLHKKKAAENAK